MWAYMHYPNANSLQLRQGSIHRHQTTMRKWIRMSPHKQLNSHYCSLKNTFNYRYQNANLHFKYERFFFLVCLRGKIDSIYKTCSSIHHIKFILFAIKKSHHMPESYMMTDDLLVNHVANKIIFNIAAMQL